MENHFCPRIPYDYNYDPDHEDHQGDPGWRNTSRGEAIGSDAKDNGEFESREFEGQHGRWHLNMLKFASFSVESYLRNDIESLSSAVEEVNHFAGRNIREEKVEADNIVTGFADKKKKEVEHVFARLVELLYGIKSDKYRRKNRKIPPISRRDLMDFAEYIRNEQDILRSSGIVNKDGTVTLYRNTTEEQFLVEKNARKPGAVLPYRGGSIESWTTNPYYETVENAGRFPGRIKISARIPIGLCVASCIGRSGRSRFMMATKGENEVMVCGAPIEKVTVVGAGKEVFQKDFVKRNFEETERNINDYIFRHDGLRKPNRTSSIRADSFVPGRKRLSSGRIPKYVLYAFLRLAVRHCEFQGRTVLEDEDFLFALSHIPNRFFENGSVAR